MRWLILATLFLVCVCGGAPISAKVLDWPDWTDGKRTLKVYIVSTDAGFQGDVRDAMAAWNTANSGNAWEFQETTDPVAADITIAEVSSGLRPGQGGVARAITKSTGFLGLGSGELVRVDVSIKAGLPAAVREVAIMHELGHCLRLAHDKGPSNVMDPMATVSTPSASDVSEALASDKDPPCPLDASTNLVREQYALVELTPKPQSGVDLANATGVTITAVTGDFSASVLGWDASKITAQIFADSTASHNEVFTATLSYNGASDISYTGVLTVADETPAVNLQPHAVPGNNITVSAGTPVILDGRQSYHDDSNTSFSGTWFVSGAEIGLFHDYGEVELPAGTYTAQLFVSDYYGRTSSATITVTVLEFKRGDANEDGQVNVSDPVYLLSWLFQGGQAPPCVDAADANDDGSVNMSDGVYLNSWLFSTGPQPPQPGPSTCGEDPTIDSLSCDSYTPCQ